MQISTPEMPTVPRIDPTAVQRSAQEVEAQFLSQFMQIAGVGRPPEGFGGGIGEEQFASFLVTEYARAMAASGGMGLAELVLRTLPDNGADR